MGRRRISREIALQALYFLDVSITAIDETDAVQNVRRTRTPQPTADEETLSFARDLVAGARGRQKELDAAIESAALNWRLDRMATVDKNILRLAAYELLFSMETPPKAVIDEAIEITRKFSAEESTKFVNGVLDKIARVAREAKKDGSQENSP